MSGRDPLGALRGIGARVRAVAGAALPEMPKLGRVVELPVYVIHISGAAEDYFFIFDFERFVEASRQGVFVRPALKVWAGRDDFNRRVFARQFRESFAREFEAARAALAAQPEKKRGWLGGVPEFFRGIAAPSLPGMLANLVLLVATSAGTKVLAQILPGNWFRDKSDAETLEEAITQTQGKVDAALGALDIALHMELYTHAWRGQTPGRMTGLDYEAWPLPDYVRQHINDGTSGAWW